MSPWSLDPNVIFLNHGSFGACPVPIQRTQSLLRRRMEREPVRFMVRELEGMLDSSRRELSAFLGTAPERLAFVPNATVGVNTALRAFPLSPGDEILVTNHGYNACRNAAFRAAEEKGARVSVASIPFPIASDDDALGAIFRAVTSRTKLALIDHVTSPTALVLPLARIARELGARGVETIVDGAHAPGMVPVAIDEIGAAFYTGNCHKWLCAPKGAGFLAVRDDFANRVNPLVTSHGANDPRTEKPRLHREFDWNGTTDFTPYLCVPEAIRFLGTLGEGGLPGLMRRNHALALQAQEILCGALEQAPPCPASMVGSMASIPLPAHLLPAPVNKIALDPLQDRLFFEHRIDVPINVWPAFPSRVLRVSAQAYNRRDQYEILARALTGAHNA
ncbi:MAG: aminotransferase class V-fold PLP-dependent enzyme [Deltaproteobacteria bacterium]|nr:aminotransferase class V-fold PLP-dependent enzyme [Deltaproteobacteria bacterium]